MACISVTTANGVSAAGRCYETASAIPAGGFSSSSSPDGFQSELEKTYVAVPGEDKRDSRTRQTMSSTDTNVTPPTTVFADDRPYTSVHGSWYPKATNYYTVSATRYPVQTGSRPQTTWSAVTWPSDDVKPTSCVLSTPPNDCNANCAQNCCKDQ